MCSLRILVAHDVCRARTGGMSRLMGCIHDQIVLAGHSVEYFCAEDMPTKLSPRWHRRLFPLYLRWHVQAAARDGKPYDIINVHEPSGAAVVRRRPSPCWPRVVVTSYGIERRWWEISLEEARLGRTGPTFRSRLTTPLFVLWQADRALRNADHVISSNEEDRAYLIERLHYPPAQITRMHSAASTCYATPGREYRFCRRLLFAGTWINRKGIEDFVPAFAQLAASHPELTLTVLGPGLPQETVRAGFPEAIRSRIRCLQTNSEEELVRIYSGHDMYILPSLFEGTPVTLIEAMMSGLPIVTTDTCGMKDVLKHETTGLLVPIRSLSALVAAVERLLADPALRERLGRAAAAEAAARYTWEQVARPILALYAELGRLRSSPHELASARLSGCEH